MAFEISAFLWDLNFLRSLFVTKTDSVPSYIREANTFLCAAAAAVGCVQLYSYNTIEKENSASCV